MELMNFTYIEAASSSSSGYTETTGDDCYEDFKNESTIPTMTEFITPKICSICRGPANCCHYDVPSCSGCKTFFRRSVLQLKNYKCKQDGLCRVEDGARCRACRFNRCVAVGMNPAAIKLPDGVNQDDVTAFITRQKRSLQVMSDDSLDSNNSALSPIIPKFIPIFQQTHNSRDIDFLCFLELKAQRLRESEFNPSHLFQMNVVDIIKIKPMLGDADKYQKIDQKPIEYNLRPHGIPVTSDNRHPDFKDWLCIDLIIIIEMIKIFSFFDKLEEDEKVSLLRRSVLINMTLMQSYYSYAQNSSTIIMPDGFAPMKMLKNPVNLEIEIFVRALEPLHRNSVTKEEYVLLKAIIMCDSSNSKLQSKSRKLLQKEQDRYVTALLGHLQAKLGEAPGAVRFGHIMGIYEAMTHFAERHRDLHVFIQMASSERFARAKDTLRPPPHRGLVEEIAESRS